MVVSLKKTGIREYQQVWEIVMDKKDFETKQCTICNDNFKPHTQVYLCGRCGQLTHSECAYNRNFIFCKHNSSTKLPEFNYYSAKLVERKEE